jgi:threonine dehydratase
MTSSEQPQVLDQQFLGEIEQARTVLSRRDSPVIPTMVIRDTELSSELGADIYFASEIAQPSGSFKIRGAENFVYNLDFEQRKRGIVTASAGNHAAGIALSSRLAIDRTMIPMNVRIYMPENTPQNKIDNVERLGGGGSIEVVRAGENFDVCQITAKAYCYDKGSIYASPFNDRLVIAGQATWGLEISKAIKPDQVISPVGGGGLIAGIATAIKSRYPETEIIGVEPEGAASLQLAMNNGKPIPLEGEIDTTIDGAAVREIGAIPFELSRHLLSRVITVSNEEAYRATTRLRERDSWQLQTELAGGLSLAGLEKLKDSVVGKTVVYLVSGRNLSRERYENEVRRV